MACESAIMQRYRVTIRDFFWLTLTVALATAWFLDHAIAWRKVDDQLQAMKKVRIEARRAHYRYRDDEIRELETENKLLHQLRTSRETTHAFHHP
jgi:hypothetical protein